MHASPIISMPVSPVRRKKLLDICSAPLKHLPPRKTVPQSSTAPLYCPPGYHRPPPKNLPAPPRGRYRPLENHWTRRCRQDEVERNIINAKGTRRFAVGDPVYMRNYQDGQKWIPAFITGMTGPRSYTLSTWEGEPERRHIDQVRSRTLSTHGDAPNKEVDDTETQYGGAQRNKDNRPA
uniref:Uncharacterized protein n=1 Tax=Trichuris muris TaxID=70415 RepID=A0A5S6Q5V6_TRIMR